ncbi:MAG: M20/M25/M40 family metallo-hydrolase [Rhizobiaceae bacterium]
MLEKISGSFEARARYFAELLVGWPSVTGSAEEARFADRLKDELAHWEIFRANPADLVRIPAPGLHDRASVMALVRGRGSATVILVGHFDTVPVDDYGDLAHLAGKPEALRKALIARLEASGADPQALEDLASGRFLPGRGMLDMKSGIAAGLAVLERFAAEQERVGNLLVIACPDEEENSSGMRSVMEILPDFLAENGLDARLTINLDAICDNEDGAAGRVVAMGCIGKLLLSALVVGKEAHACYPLDGVNAAYLAAELAAEMEYAPELGEISPNGLASPPTVLGLKDLKPGYNVTIPSRVWAFWNVLLHQRKGVEMMAAAKGIAARAAKRAAERMRDRASRLGAGVVPTPSWQDIPILTYEALRTKAEQSSNFVEDFAALAGALAARDDLDLPTRSRELVEFVWNRSGLQGPAIVLCVGSMPYPAIVWPDGFSHIEDAIDRAIAAVTAAHGETIAKHAFFPAIADMSFAGPIDRDDLRAVAADTPLWGSSIRWPESAASLHIPTINVGPWGRDYHHWLERTHDSYTFRVLPDLVQAIAKGVLELT